MSLSAYLHSSHSFSVACDAMRFLWRPASSAASWLPASAGGGLDGDCSYDRTRASRSRTSASGSTGSCLPRSSRTSTAFEETQTEENPTAPETSPAEAQTGSGTAETQETAPEQVEGSAGNDVVDDGFEKQCKDGLLFDDRSSAAGERKSVAETMYKTKAEVDKKYEEEKARFKEEEFEGKRKALEEAYEHAFLPFPDRGGTKEQLDRGGLLDEQNRILSTEDPVEILSTKASDLQALKFRELADENPKKRQFAIRSLAELKKRWDPNFIHGDDRVVQKVDQAYRALFPSDEDGPSEDPEPMSPEDEDMFPEAEWADASGVPRRGFVPPEFVVDLERTARNVLRDVDAVEHQAREALERAYESFAQHRALTKVGLESYMNAAPAYRDPDGVVSPFSVPRRFMFAGRPGLLSADGIGGAAGQEGTEVAWENDFKAKKFAEML
mmetsp:Transcript_27767/g.70097  ORF Transcript_27767/g.70097 Transcript_27767/m.70097 type:complete len:441 (+) Transcript_27767:194-1516(+)